MDPARARAPPTVPRDFAGLSTTPAQSPWPQRNSSSNAFVAHEPVPVVRAAVVQVQRVHHRVAVERVVAAEGVVQRVLGVTQVDAVELVGELADHLEAGDVVLGRLRSPRPVR